MNLTSTFTLLQPYSLGFSTIYELNHLLHCWWGIWSGPDIAKVVFIVAIVTLLDANETIKLLQFRIDTLRLYPPFLSNFVTCDLSHSGKRTRSLSKSNVFSSSPSS